MESKKYFSMMVFVAGKEARYKNKWYTIEYVHVSKRTLTVRLEGITDLINSDELYCEPQLIQYTYRTR